MNEWMDEWLARETGRSSHGLTGFIIQCSAVQIMLLKTIFGLKKSACFRWASCDKNEESCDYKISNFCLTV